MQPLNIYLPNKNCTIINYAINVPCAVNAGQPLLSFVDSDGKKCVLLSSHSGWISAVNIAPGVLITDHSPILSISGKMEIAKKLQIAEKRNEKRIPPSTNKPPNSRVQLDYSSDVNHETHSLLRIPKKKSFLKNKSVSVSVQTPMNANSKNPSLISFVSILDLLKFNEKYIPNESEKLLLVLDLDHTLVHTVSDARAQIVSKYPSISDTIFKIKIQAEIKSKWHFIKFRPFLFQFLHCMRKYYHIMIYTNGKRLYVEQLLQLLDTYATKNEENSSYFNNVLPFVCRESRLKLHELILKRIPKCEQNENTLKSVEKQITKMRKVKSLNRIFNRLSDISQKRKSDYIFNMNLSKVLVVDDRNDNWDSCTNLWKIAQYRFWPITEFGDEWYSLQTTAETTMLNSVSESQKIEQIEPIAEKPLNFPKREIIDLVTDDEDAKASVKNIANDSPVVNKGSSVSLSANLISLRKKCPMLDGQQWYRRPDAKKSDWAKEKMLKTAANDNILLTLKNVLKVAHIIYMNNEYEVRNVKNGTNSEWKLKCKSLVKKLSFSQVMKKLKKTVLHGVICVFSGIFPVGQSPDTQPIWKLCLEYGAQCELISSDRVTHVIACNAGTYKVRDAQRNGKWAIHVNWVFQSIFHFQKCDEKKFAFAYDENSSQLKNVSFFTENVISAKDLLEKYYLYYYTLERCESRKLKIDKNIVVPMSKVSSMAERKSMIQAIYALMKGKISVSYSVMKEYLLKIFLDQKNIPFNVEKCDEFVKFFGNEFQIISTADGIFLQRKNGCKLKSAEIQMKGNQKKIPAKKRFRNKFSADNPYLNAPLAKKPKIFINNPNLSASLSINTSQIPHSSLMTNIRIKPPLISLPHPTINPMLALPKPQSFPLQNIYPHPSYVQNPFHPPFIPQQSLIHQQQIAAHLKNQFTIRALMMNAVNQMNIQNTIHFPMNINMNNNGPKWNPRVNIVNNNNKKLPMVHPLMINNNTFVPVINENKASIISANKIKTFSDKNSDISHKNKTQNKSLLNTRHMHHNIDAYESDRRYSRSRSRSYSHQRHSHRRHKTRKHRHKSHRNHRSHKHRIQRRPRINQRMHRRRSRHRYRSRNYIDLDRPSSPNHEIYETAGNGTFYRENTNVRNVERLDAEDEDLFDSLLKAHTKQK